MKIPYFLVLLTAFLTLLPGASAFDQRKLDLQTFERLNRADQDLLAPQNREKGTGTRDGGYGRVRAQVLMAEQVGVQFERAAELLGRLDYDQIADAGLRVRYMLALRDGLITKFVRSQLIFLDQCRDGSGSYPVVYPSSPQGAICISLAAMEDLLKTDLVAAFAKIELDRYVQGDGEFAVWLASSTPPGIRDYEILRREYNLSTQAVSIPADLSGLRCLLAFPDSSLEITDEIDGGVSGRLGSRGSLLFRSYGGYIKCVPR